MIVVTPTPPPFPAAGGVTASPAAVVVFEAFSAEDEETAPLAAELESEAVPSAAPVERAALSVAAAG